MIRFQALGIRVSLPLLTLIFPVLAGQLGMKGSMGGLFLALGLHELAHVLAAKWLGVEIREIRLMPFGGSARMENPYGVPAVRLLPVAAAGPAVNLLLTVVCAAMMQWGWVKPVRAAAFMQHNLVLCLFNLLPALPLDGGRILYALLQGRLGEMTALKMGLWLGRILAGGLLLLAFLGGWMHGRWNLSFLLAALFILASEGDERSALVRSRAQRLCRSEDADEILPVRFYRVGRDVDVRTALGMLRPREQACFLLRGGMVRQEDILAHIIRNGAADALLCELVPARDVRSVAPKV